MSFKMMQLVWDHSKAKANHRLVLLAIADHHNDKTGYAWPSVETIAKKIGATARTVQACFNSLCVTGELAIDLQAGPYGCNAYRILVANPGEENASANLLSASLPPAETAPPPQLSHPNPPAEVAGVQKLRGADGITGGVQNLRGGGADGITRTLRTVTEPLVGEPTNRGAEVAGVQKLRGAEVAGGSITVVATEKLNYLAAEALLDHLNAVAGLTYPRTRAALDAAAFVLHDCHGDLEGAKKATTRQVTLFKADTKKAHWLRPSTLFDRERFANLYAERALPLPGQAPCGSKRLELEARLKNAAGPEERQQIRQQLQELQTA